MNAYDIFPVVYSHNTNNIPSIDDKKAINDSKELAKFFNKIMSEL